MLVPLQAQFKTTFRIMKSKMILAAAFAAISQLAFAGGILMRLP